MQTRPTTLLTLMTSGIAAGLCVPQLQGCDPGSASGADAVCGDCGELRLGQVSLSGDARLDGLFAALVRLRDATGQVRADFEADVLALADVYGVARGEVNAELVGDVVTAIQADIDGHVDGGLQIMIEPARCEASVSAAVSAQASCEAQAGCDVEVEPGQVAVQCEGTCTGQCSGMCSGDLSCAVKTPTVECEGTCEGTCELETAGACEGECRGSCNNGDCRNECQGTCELAGRAQCSGTCHGTCYVDQGSAQCTAEAECAGSCSADCSGSCEGEFVPPSASAQCEAEAECQAQAQAQANASLECTPPSLTFAFDLRGGIDASAEAAFRARLSALRVHGAAILQGVARLRALVDGTVDGEVVFEPAPLVDIQNRLEGLGKAAIEADFDIPAGKIPCAIDGAIEGTQMVIDVTAEANATLQAQAKLATFLGA